MTEQELVARAQKGSEDAFAQLMGAYQNKVYHLALRLTSNPDDAAELTQEAFFKAWQSLSSFQGSSAFSTWLYRLTNNLCIDFLRSKRRRQVISSARSLDDEELHQREVPDPRLTPQGEVERQELREAVRQAIDLLSPEHRSVLVLREISGLSYTEISQVLDLEEGTVKSRLARARLALRKILLAHGNLFAPPPSN